jgi:hypothetical protein
MRAIQMKPIQGLFMEKEHKALKIVPMGVSRHPIDATANGSSPQRTPWTTTEPLHHFFPATSYFNPNYDCSVLSQGANT